MTPNLFRRIAEWWNRPAILPAVCNPPPPPGPRPLPSPRSYPPMPTVKPPDSAVVSPLTADEVRKIVREEIERAMRPGKSGRMGPG